jgi:2-oxoisovalerate dehydrogenase E1 component
MNNQKIIKSAVASRLIEEKFLEIFSSGKLNGTVHTCIGQEFSGAAVLNSIRDDDFIFSNHRCHGHFMSSRFDADGLISELMGRSSGVSGGLGGSQHLFKDGFYSNGIQGGIVPVSAGLAYGQKLKGKGGISIVFIGDGTLGEGVIYECFNLVSKWSLPLLVVLEDNKYSQSTSQEETLAGEIEARFEAFGIETFVGNTWDWKNLAELSSNIIERIRKDSRPRFLRVETYRLKAHSKGDDTRSRDEVEPYEKLDPLNIFLNNLSIEDEKWVQELNESINTALLKSENAPQAILPNDYFNNFFKSQEVITWSLAKKTNTARYVTILNETFASLMEEHQNILMLGEDIKSPYGGAFKATKGLSEKFPDRVRNTPISEAGIVGVGAGLGLMQFFPIVEIMFGDFVGLAFDQLVNHAAKFKQMYNQQVSCNLIVRTPMGGGRGYGPTHSQTLDKHFIGVPGLRVVALNSFTHPECIYKPLINKNAGPTLVLENKLMYGSYFQKMVPEGFSLLHSNAVFPDALIKPDSNQVDVTLLGYGGTAEMMADAANILFEDHDIIAQVVVISMIYPFCIEPYIDLIQDSDSLILIEEGQGFASFSSEVISQLAERDLLASLTVRRVMPEIYCIPSSGSLEKEVLPDVSKIVKTVLSLNYHD